MGEDIGECADIGNWLGFYYCGGKMMNELIFKGLLFLVLCILSAYFMNKGYGAKPKYFQYCIIADLLFGFALLIVISL